MADSKASPALPMAASATLPLRFSGDNLQQMEERLDELHARWTRAVDDYHEAIAVPIDETLAVAYHKGTAAVQDSHMYNELFSLQMAAHALGQPAGSTLPEAFQRNKMELVWSQREKTLLDLHHAEEFRRLQLENTMLKAERLVHKSSHV